MNSAQLLPAICDLYSRQAEYWHHEPWELQWMYALNYTAELDNEDETAAAVEVTRGDWPQWRVA